MPTCGSSSSPITTPTSRACPPIPPGPWSGSARPWTSIRAPRRGRRAAGGARPCREVRRRGFAGRPAARPAPLRGAARHRAAAPHRRTYGLGAAPGLGPLRRPGPPARGPRPLLPKPLPRQPRPFPASRPKSARAYVALEGPRPRGPLSHHPCNGGSLHAASAVLGSRSSPGEQADRLRVRTKRTHYLSTHPSKLDLENE